ncbi:MAG: S-layer homology domain-containing protein [Actinomycetia bacterium]|nr:S-layer homology domain-containing protein [Actinomycetes bacterium]
MHASSIGALYAAGITAGCSREPVRFCPDQPVTRAQMAAFLTRALNLAVPGAGA